MPRGAMTRFGKTPRRGAPPQGEGTVIQWATTGPCDEPMLTRRQREVLLLLVDGTSNTEIALRLGITARTVEVHLHRIRKRLGITPVALLTRFAIRAGWITA
jgi:DNA-binding NarL/FixJ family response regulator